MRICVILPTRFFSGLFTSTNVSPTFFPSSSFARSSDAAISSNSLLGLSVSSITNQPAGASLFSEYSTALPTPTSSIAAGMSGRAPAVRLPRYALWASISDVLARSTR